MQLKTLLSKVETISVNGTLDCEITSVSYDSRMVQPGTLFVALRGGKADGHHFIKQVLEKGAVAVLVEEGVDAGSRATEVRVKSTRKALADIAAAFYHNPSHALKVTGITGTKGKTTVAFLLKHICEHAFLRCGLIGTVRYEIGERILPAARTTPESLGVHELLYQMRSAGCKASVMEVSSHALMQERVRGVEFDVGVFTNLKQDHLDYHVTMEMNYFEAKARLFENLARAENGNGGEGGHQCGRHVRRAARRAVRQGAAGDHLRREHARGFPRERVQNRFFGNHVPARCAGEEFPGAAAAHGAVQYLQCTRRARRGLRTRARPAHRGAQPRAGARGAGPPRAGAGQAEIPRVRGLRAHGGFAAQCDENAARAFAEPTHRVRTWLRRKPRPAPSARSWRAAVEQNADYAIITSDNPRKEEPEAIIEDVKKGFQGTSYEVIVDRKEAIQRAIALAEPRDIVLIAGKGHETYQEFADHTIPFDDVATAGAAIEANPVEYMA